MEQICCVCNEPLDPDNMSRCHMCGGYFHMPWITTTGVQECGHYGMYENRCGLAFICDLCKDKIPTQDTA